MYITMVMCVIVTSSVIIVIITPIITIIIISMSLLHVNTIYALC